MHLHRYYPNLVFALIVIIFFKGTVRLAESTSAENDRHLLTAVGNELSYGVAAAGDQSAKFVASVPDEVTQRSSLLFIENVGQWDPQARFQMQDGTGTFWFAEDGIWLTVLEPPSKDKDRCPLKTTSPPGMPGVHPCSSQNDYSTIPVSAQTSGDVESLPRAVNLKLTFANANVDARVVGISPLDTTVSYFLGRDSTTWYPSVPVFGGVRYENIYPGIDIEFVSMRSGWQPRIKAEPGADLSVVVLQMEGAESLSLRGNGTFQIQTHVGALELPLLANTHGLNAPIIQDQTIERPFAPLTEANRQISTPAAQQNHEQLIYGTYLGGISKEYSFSIAVDMEGAAYITGLTWSTDFPVTPGAVDPVHSGWQDNFVAKLSPDGSTLVYATFLGRSLESAYMAELTNTVVVDSAGYAYVAGRTDSSDFPVTSGAYQTVYKGREDGYVAKLSPSGSALIYATYLGDIDWDIINSIALGSNGEVLVTGITYSANFPTTPGVVQENHAGLSDVFVARLNAAGSDLVFSTFLGGEGWDARYSGGGIAVDASGAVYITGGTESQNFPTTAGAFQTQLPGYYSAFVTKISSDATSLLFSTFLGGSIVENWRGGWRHQGRW